MDIRLSYKTQNISSIEEAVEAVFIMAVKAVECQKTNQARSSNIKNGGSSKKWKQGKLLVDSG